MNTTRISTVCVLYIDPVRIIGFLLIIKLYKLLPGFCSDRNKIIALKEKENIILK